MVFMDNETKESLDFQYILNMISTITPYGMMYKEKMKPFVLGQEEALIEELNKLECYIPYVKDKDVRRAFNNIFGHIKDLRNSVKRAMEGSILTEIELFEIKNFLFLIRNLNKLMKDNEIPTWKDMEIEPIEKLESLLDPESTGISTFYIYDCYSEQLKAIRESKRETDKEIKLEKKTIKEKIKEELKIDLRPDGTVVIPKDNQPLLEKIENYPHLTYVSETYMNIKFTIKPTENITLLERKLLLLKDQEEREELKVREMLSKEIGKRRKSLFKNMASIGKIDLILGKAKYGLDIEGVKPNIVKDHVISIEEGRHPKVEAFLKEKDLKFTPISIELKEGVACITGANMGGKTISLKLVGLLTAMAHYGLFIPAKGMTLGLSEYIKCSIGDMQSTDNGLSTFGGEIKIVQEAIEKSTAKGLVLIDELARGTNPDEGYAISKAIVSYLKDKEAITLLTTHYDNVANLDKVVHLQVVGLSKVDFADLVNNMEHENKMDLINRYMDYRLRVVKKDRNVPRDALNIARIMGLDKEILDTAEKILKEK
ncbi:DNA mismatch repair protein MutS [Tissierella sp. MSJ-40]|uniref:DNA mismatch repair protein MutS n=1 Tax=Tissierella simiarum TaxID=2841534 RepID=A0ABS6E2E0_9FIRM|nr:DNA mismatch repair protein MutS [Tissierella simiarum]MBU5437006.1 DNA mismatch repair protein MutS [Tissierella simiarum]